MGTLMQQDASHMASMQGFLLTNVLLFLVIVARRKKQLLGNTNVFAQECQDCSVLNINPARILALDHMFVCT